jgi:hypothetical protein
MSIRFVLWLHSILCVTLPHFAYLQLMDTWAVAHFMGVVNNSAVNILAQALVWSPLLWTFFFVLKVTIKFIRKGID